MFSNWAYYLLIGVVVAVCIKVYMDSEMYNLKCVISGVDGNRYCVRDRESTDEAADLLATCTNNCINLVKYMEQNHSDDPRIQKLVKGFNPKAITETLPTSELTAYSENKGEKIAVCLNKTKDSTKLIDINSSYIKIFGKFCQQYFETPPEFYTVSMIMYLKFAQCN